MKKKKRDLKKEHVLFSGKDIGLCVLLMVLSAIITFINLGDTRFPTSAFHAEKEQPIIIGFGRMVSLQGSVYLNAENSNQRFLVLFWNDDDGTCVPFLALMAAYFIKTLPAQRHVRYTIAFVVLILALFVAFYPVLAGTSFSSQGYIKGLQWLPDWHFAK